MTDDRIKQTLASLWVGAGLDTGELDAVQIAGQDPTLPSVFRVGEAAAASVAAAGAAAAQLWRLRSGDTQGVSVDVRAALAAFRSERYLLIDGESPASPWGPLSGYYPTGDDRHVQLHANFPHHHQGLIDLLNCGDSKQSVAAALLNWDGEVFEREASDKGLCAGLLRSRQEWEAHGQGKAVAGLPLIEIERIGDSAPESLPGEHRPLTGIRALDLSRILAGPVCGRTLASHGAQVLRIGSAHLPLIPHIWLDLARGKRSAHLDLRQDGERQKLLSLSRECDVFLQAYRPGSLEARGLGPEDIAAVRPGAIYVTISAYGHEGPWATRRGFDSLVQTVSGIGHAGAVASGVAGTRPLPCQALDHATGYLAAFGAMVALRRRAEVGGSYHVRVSLAQTGHWLWNLGQIDGLDHPNTAIEEIADLLESQETMEGRVTAVRPPEVLEVTPARWERSPVPLGHDPACWL